MATPRWSPWRPGSEMQTSRAPARQVPGLVTAVKTVHTLAWFSIEAAFVYLLYAGFARRSDRRAALAGAIVASESLVYVGNGCRCPLTQLAERYGAVRGSVTDIFLPDWFAHNIPAIHTPLLPLVAYLHARNLRQSRPLGGRPAILLPSSPSST